MIVKVCGLNNCQNIQDVAQLKPDFLGFIFTNQSRRQLEPTSGLRSFISALEVSKAGVFVDADLGEISQVMSDFNLTTVQLHGNESPEEVHNLKKEYEVIKAFSVHENFDFKLDDYEEADLFLFDTKGKSKGGNGKKFNWDLLDRYPGKTPFLLSGGIRLTDVDEIKNIAHPKFAGIDINSGFEVSAGVKNVHEVNELLAKIR